jgi:hypothetical protein
MLNIKEKINISPERKAKLYRVFKIVLIVVIAVCIANFFSRGMSHHWDSNKTENTISFTGHGEVSAVPDIANISFTISKDAKTVKEAQAQVATVEKQALYSLKSNNVLDKDIKTTNASFYPKYEYVNDTKIAMPCNQFGCPPQPGKNVITGYTASESITIKVRNTDTTGKIIEDLGGLGVSDLNGPNFAIDKEDSLKESARKLAIDEAKLKAKTLAKDLGIRLGKITAFNEGGNYPVPMYETAKMDIATGGNVAPAVLPVGENTISSDITITYEIR